jgi:hypothetical protein
VWFCFLNRIHTCIQMQKGSSKLGDDALGLILHVHPTHPTALTYRCLENAAYTWDLSWTRSESGVGGGGGGRWLEQVFSLRGGREAFQWYQNLEPRNNQILCGAPYFIGLQTKGATPIVNKSHWRQGSTFLTTGGWYSSSRGKSTYLASLRP